MVLRGSRLCVGPWGSPLAEGGMRAAAPRLGLPSQRLARDGERGLGAPVWREAWLFGTHTHTTHTDTSHGAQAGGGCPWLIVPRLDMEMCPA